MRWFDWLINGERSSSPRLPALPPTVLPALRYAVPAGDLDPVPPEIVLTRRDGTSVTYVPKQEPAPGLAWPPPGASGHEMVWRRIGEPWPEDTR